MVETRYKVRFKETAALEASLAMELAGAVPVVVNPKRNYISVVSTVGLKDETDIANAAGANVPFAAESMRSLETLAREFGAEIVPDYQYELDQGDSFLIDAAPDAEQGSLNDVIRIINAEPAWTLSRGENVTIAIVDTGIHGAHPEFPAARRAGGWAVPGDDPWTDWQGHGTMCACIAAANSHRYTGVAPDARIMSCKTRFYDGELGLIYDTLTDRANEGEIIVASNSFGRRTGASPQPPSQSDFLPALGDAIAAGVFVAFSAGNNHALAGGQPTACNPTSIWLHKSREDVLAVATCDLNDDMWDYSSRGPGQFHGQAGTNRKPDVTAPTPRNGRILYGGGERVLANGWGTSGACPQAAGLLALIRSAAPQVGHLAAFDVIRRTARDLQLGWDCCGDGVIDCRPALETVLVKPATS